MSLNTKVRYKGALAPPPNFEFTQKNQDGGQCGEQQGTLSICYNGQKHKTYPEMVGKYQ